MRQSLLCVLLLVAALSLCGCGQKEPEPVQRTDPLPRERFPRADK